MGLREVDELVAHDEKLPADSGPIGLSNDFNLVPDHVERFFEITAVLNP
jgi:hypothetical protein